MRCLNQPTCMQEQSWKEMFEAANLEIANLKAEKNDLVQQVEVAKNLNATLERKISALEDEIAVLKATPTPASTRIPTPTATPTTIAAELTPTATPTATAPTKLFLHKKVVSKKATPAIRAAAPGARATRAATAAARRAATSATTSSSSAASSAAASEEAAAAAPASGGAAAAPASGAAAPAPPASGAADPPEAATTEATSDAAPAPSEKKSTGLKERVNRRARTSSKMLHSPYMSEVVPKKKRTSKKKKHHEERTQLADELGSHHEREKRYLKSVAHKNTGFRVKEKSIKGRAFLSAGQEQLVDEFMDEWMDE